MKALIQAVFLGTEEGSFPNRETGRLEPYVRASFLQDLDTHKYYIRDDAGFDIRQIAKGADVVLTVEITVRADKTYQSLIDVEEGTLLIEEPLVGKDIPQPAVEAVEKEAATTPAAEKETAPAGKPSTRSGK